MTKSLEKISIFSSPGHRHAQHGYVCPNDGVPDEHSRMLQHPADYARALMTQPDLFSDMEAECAASHIQPSVRTQTRRSPRSFRPIAPFPDADKPDLLALMNDAEPRVDQPDLQRQIASADINGCEFSRSGEEGIRQNILIHPWGHSASKHIQSRMAGDIVVCTTPPATFAEAVEAIAASGTVLAERVTTFRDSVRWIEQRRPRNRDGSAADPLPCDPVLLRPILKQIVPGRHKISDKRWYNIQSEIAAIQRKTGWLKPRTGAPVVNEKAWLDVLALAENDKRRAMLGHFAVFCEAEKLLPADVRAMHLEKYHEQIKKTARKRPEAVIATIRYAWKRLMQEHPNLGGIPFPEKRDLRQIRDASDILPSFQEDLDAYIAKLRNPGLFAPGFRARTSEATIRTRVQMYLCTPSILIRRGWAAAQFTSMASILTPAAVEALLTDFHERNSKGKGWTLGAEAQAQALKAAAHQWGNLSPEDIAEVDRICSCVRAPHHGFSETKQKRLAQFDDKALSRRFFNLPSTLWAKARKLDREGKQIRAAQTAKYALALAILIDKPLRVLNLARLDLALDFVRDYGGRITGIRIEGERTTKNAVVIEGQLSPETLRMLKGYIEHYRDRLCKSPGSAVFPGKNGHSVTAKGLSTGFREKIHREIGAEVNPHLLRSLLATIILDDNPRAVPLVQRALDHKSPASGLRNYAAQRGRAVNAEYAAALERHRKKLKNRE